MDIEKLKEAIAKAKREEALREYLRELVEQAIAWNICPECAAPSLKESRKLLRCEFCARCWNNLGHAVKG